MPSLTKKQTRNLQKVESGDRITDIVVTVLMIVLALIALYPLYFTIIASISNPAYIAKGKVVLLPKGVTSLAYEALFAEKRIWIGYRNSIFYTIAFTLINLFVTIPCAYALSRPTLPGRKGLFLFFTITMYFTGGTVPTYLLMNKLKLINTVWIMIIPHGVSATNLIICRNYFTDNIPESLYESARIDGANLFQFFSRFVVPLSKPIISVMALYFSIAKWNAYFEPMIYIQDNNKQTLQVIIRSITAALDSSMTDALDPDALDRVMQQQQLLKYAVVIVAALPLMLMYPFIQRYLISGVMVGAVKE